MSLSSDNAFAAAYRAVDEDVRVHVRPRRLGSNVAAVEDLVFAIYISTKRTSS